jgi:hypothetical protein
MHAEALGVTQEETGRPDLQNQNHEGSTKFKSKTLEN